MATKTKNNQKPKTRARRVIKTKVPLATVTAGTTIRMQKPKSPRRAKVEVVELVQEINPVGGFAKFIRDYGVIGVAVGFAIASQAQILIRSLMDNVVTPVYTVIFNVATPEKAVLVLNFNGRESTLNWGVFLNQFINFLFVLVVIYAVFKLLALERFSDKKDKK